MGYRTERKLRISSARRRCGARVTGAGTPQRTPTAARLTQNRFPVSFRRVRTSSGVSALLRAFHTSSGVSALLQAFPHFFRRFRTYILTQAFPRFLRRFRASSGPQQLDCRRRRRLVVAVAAGSVAPPAGRRRRQESALPVSGQRDGGLRSSVASAATTPPLPPPAAPQLSPPAAPPLPPPLPLPPLAA